jgi:outer membrane biosynthesis protein TonB
MTKKIALLVMLGPLASACASAQARSPMERPALEMPPVPERVIEMTHLEPAPPEPVGELPPPPAPAPTPRPRNTPPRDTTAKPPDPKPEAAPVEPAAVTTPAPAPVLPQLRTPGTPDGPEASRLVGEVVERARKMLKSIDYGRLKAASRAEYDSANRTIKQSEAALKEGKFDIALNLAEKAERIAKELQAR